MAEQNPKEHSAKKASSVSTASQPKSDKQLQEILARAKQAVKPIVNREASNEVVSDDLLSFRMKGAAGD